MLRRILNLAPEGAVAAPPAPAATPAPAPVAPKPAAEPSADIFDDPEFKALETPPKPQPKKPDAKTPDKPPEKPEKKPEVKPADKPADKKPETPVEEKPESMGIKQLRQRGDKALQEVTTLKEQLSARDAKIAEYEKNGKSSEAIIKRVADLEKQLEEKDKRLYALNVAETQEFKDKYVQPYLSAADDAKSEVERMEVAVKDGEGNVTGARPASWENDFAQIFHLNKSSVTKANQKAREIFGDDAGTVMGLVQNLYRLDKAKGKALTDLQTNADTNRQKEKAESEAMKEWSATAWVKINTDLSEKTPEYFQADPQDKQRGELFTKSLALVDARHNGKALTPIQQVTLDAQTRLRAAAFPVLKYDVAKLKDRIGELEGEVAELRGVKGKPGDTQHQSGDAAPAPEKGIMEELNEVLSD